MIGIYSVNWPLHKERVPHVQWFRKTEGWIRHWKCDADFWTQRGTGPPPRRRWSSCRPVPTKGRGRCCVKVGRCGVGKRCGLPCRRSHTWVGGGREMKGPGGTTRSKLVSQRLGPGVVSECRLWSCGPWRRVHVSGPGCRRLRLAGERFEERGPLLLLLGFHRGVRGSNSRPLSRKGLGTELGLRKNGAF